MNSNTSQELNFNAESCEEINIYLNSCTTWYFEENDFLNDEVVEIMSMHRQDTFESDCERIEFKI